MAKISSILIANRGEIAARVIRTAKTLGIKAIAVYSEADKDALHVRLADQAVLIGPAPVGESYLKIDTIIAAAKSHGADAIHPGYGFLSENAEFAQACDEAGIIFIGPPQNAIHVMGNKAEAKRRMIAADVPCVPGYEGEDQSDDVFVREADRIGYPIMVKAAAGGGGRGMRLVDDETRLADALRTARSEAQNAFGSGELILEKAVMEPRHVEIQVFADAHGTVVHLGERDCSVQRRHQKVIEEAPSPAVTPAIRKAMGEAAVNAARAVDYRGAGTVEFLLDAEGRFYFLEMNTRLQVEHPVTEAVTGLDLVALQINVAEGAPLGLAQDDVSLTGHAIEVRLYAEDPDKDFLPVTGPVHQFHVPTSVRCDAGIESGQEITPFYDPMVAKVIAHGETRDEARAKLIAALEQTVLFGSKTNQRFLIDCLAHPVFAGGQATTHFIADHAPGGTADWDWVVPAATLIFEQRARDEAQAAAISLPGPMMGWSSAQALPSRFELHFGEDSADVSVLGNSLTHGEAAIEARLVSLDDGVAQIRVGDQRLRVSVWAESERALWLGHEGRSIRVENRLGLGADAGSGAGAGKVLAPMHGALLSVAVTEGETVTRGQVLGVLEAMKMQHDLVADCDGTVKAVAAAAGEQIAADALIIEIEPFED